MTKIPLNKTFFDKDDFDRLVDKSFRQLISQAPQDTEFTVDDFFNLYDLIFDQIPREGDINSHRYILTRESEFLGVQLEGVDIQSLLNEVTSLRQELLDTNKTLLDLTK